MENLTMKFKEILRILRRFDETYKMCNQWENVLSYANKININPRHDENGIKRNYLNLSRTILSYHTQKMIHFDGCLHFVK